MSTNSVKITRYYREDGATATELEEWLFVPGHDIAQKPPPDVIKAGNLTGERLGAHWVPVMVACTARIITLDQFGVPDMSDYGNAAVRPGVKFITKAHFRMADTTSPPQVSGGGS